MFFSLFKYYVYITLVHVLILQFFIYVIGFIPLALKYTNSLL